MIFLLNFVGFLVLVLVFGDFPKSNTEILAGLSIFSDYSLQVKLCENLIASLPF